MGRCIKLKDNIKIAIIIALGLALATFIYSDGVTKRQEARFEKDRRDEMQAEIDLIDCEADAFTAYDSWWDRECEDKGLGVDCSLPSYNADRLQESYESDLDRCYR
jgi:hypothetical protein